MKKNLMLLALIGILPVMGFAEAGEYKMKSRDYYSTRPTKTSSYKKTSTSRKTGGYTNTITNNFYYTQPAQNNSYAPSSHYSDRKMASYDGMPVVTQKKVSKVTESYSSQNRKYFLAHPFFQPLKGRFGSVTDFSFGGNNFNFDILNASILDISPASANYGKIIDSGLVDLNGKAETTQFIVKEDFSFGLSDSLALIGMIQYDKTKVGFKDWSDGTPDDSISDSGVNVFGVGLQNRFVDNEEWIAMLAGFYQHQRKTANTFTGELKAGYKVDKTTIYGLGRVGYSSLTNDNDMYGAYVKDEIGDWLMLSYKNNVKDIIYAEAGIGAFAVLSKDFTLNAEAVFGYYDWHEQLNIKGALGWQPGSMFALNVYGMASVFDSATDKVNKYMNYDINPNLPSAVPSTDLVYTTGDYKIKDYSEWKLGVQAILYF